MRKGWRDDITGRKTNAKYEASRMQRVKKEKQRKIQKERE
jgi:hypothetical protein